MKSVSSVYLNTLNFPQVTWICFLREFFSKTHLMKMSDGVKMPNKFFYDEGKPAHLRDFQIVMSHDYKEGKDNSLPALVIEDASGAQQMGTTIDQRTLDIVSPERRIDRHDLMRFTYVFHCLSKNRGESQLLASIIGGAITGFRDELKQMGFNQLLPWSIGTTQAIRSDSDEDYVDTQVQVTFFTVEGWVTKEIPTGTAAELDLIFQQPDTSRYVKMFTTIALPAAHRWLHMSSTIQDPATRRYVHASANVVLPVASGEYLMISASVIEPVFSTSFVRTSAKIKTS